MQDIIYTLVSIETRNLKEQAAIDSVIAILEDIDSLRATMDASIKDVDYAEKRG